MLDDNFKLDDLLKLELHKFADEVGEIVDCAQKEEKMEQGLAKLKVQCKIGLQQTCMTSRHTSQATFICCHLSSFLALTVPFLANTPCVLL